MSIMHIDEEAMRGYHSLLDLMERVGVDPKKVALRGGCGFLRHQTTGDLLFAYSQVVEDADGHPVVCEDCNTVVTTREVVTL